MLPGFPVAFRRTGIRFLAILSRQEIGLPYGQPTGPSPGSCRGFHVPHE